MKSRMIGTVAAFALAVVSALTVTADDVTLPAGYTKLDYIASTGTQYINTGCQLVDRTSITMDLGHFRRVGDGENYIFGRVSGANYYDAIVSGSKLRFVGTANGTTLDSDIGDWAEKDIHLVLDGGDGTQKGGKYVGSVSISKDGGTPVVTEVETSYTVNNAYPFCVFGRAGMNLSSYRLCGMTATRPDGTAIFDLVPCIDPNGDIGVYDLVRKGFLGNGGTGRFLTPSDVNHDLVANGGFDAGSTGSAETWAYSNASGFSCPNWTLSSMVGLSAANGVWVSSTQIVGKYAFFMQGGGIDRTATQVLTVTRAGDYVLTFAHAIRPGYSAGQARVELLDGSGNLVGESVSVTGEAAFKTESVLYPALAAGTYTLKLCEVANSGGNSAFDNVSFCPAVQYAEEGAGLFVYDGDFSLGGIAFGDKSFVIKNGTGDLVVPASCAALPSVRIRSGALNVQDGVATAYTLNGELRLDGGTTLKIDFADGACDSFIATGVDVSSASRENRVLIDVSAAAEVTQVANCHLLVSGAGLTADDARKFKVVGLKGRVFVENGDLYLDAPVGLFVVIQ